MSKGYRYSDEFKQEAVNQVTIHGYAVVDVATRFPVCQPKHEPTDFEITYKSGCLGERNAKANDYC